ncbi:aminoacyl-tRNA hydrolase [Pelagibacteraceae bacterium]|nr:aminoacyl-tRNA hydrolase [Pelagibacteraceae bacterium]
MFLICGLGNPGKEYINTRHNIGFKLIDKLANFYNFDPFKKDTRKEIFKGNIDNNSCLLIKPLNFMNLSGLPIREVVSFYKIEKNKIFIIHDDLDLELGKIKIKFGGGNGGHNGLSSIDEIIGKEYYRIRVGIDHPGMKHLVSNYVLNKFNAEEIKKIDNQLDNITKNFETLLNDTGLFLTKLAKGK